MAAGLVQGDCDVTSLSMGMCGPVFVRSEVLKGILVNFQVLRDMMMCHGASSNPELLDCEDGSSTIL